jgi:2-keto-4-pentenoate hydratase
MDDQSNLDTLVAARRDPALRPARLPEPPRDNASAYYLQHSVAAGLGPIGGWKVGSPSPTGPFTCAPLPASHIMPSPARVQQDACPDRGVEAEIAVRLAADLPPRDLEYTRDEVLAAIGSAHPAIELLQSRFQDVNAVDPLSALADSLSHHGLVWGDAIPGWQSIDLDAEGVRVLVNGEEIKRATGNPAGDMLRLVTWLANEGARWAGGLKAGQLVTTGSWTAKDFVPPGAAVRMVFEHCGSVEVQYT